MISVQEMVELGKEFAEEFAEENGVTVDLTPVECGIPDGYEIKAIRTAEPGEKYLAVDPNTGESFAADVLSIRTRTVVIVLEPAKLKWKRPDWLRPGVYLAKNANGTWMISPDPMVLATDGFWNSPAGKGKNAVSVGWLINNILTPHSEWTPPECDDFRHSQFQVAE